MTRVWLMVLVVFCHEIFSNGVVTNMVTNISTRPSVVNVGAILAYKSTIGKVAKVAIEAAIEDVNSDPTVLAGTKINLTMHDSHNNGFLGIVESKLFVYNPCLFVHLSYSLKVGFLESPIDCVFFFFFFHNSFTVHGERHSGHNWPLEFCNSSCNFSNFK